MAPWTIANYGSGADVLLDIDPANFTGLVDGDPIATGQDSSGNGRHMTAAGSARPTWQTAELDGKAVARFDGTDDVAGIADTGLSGQPFVLAAVTRFAAPIAADASLFAGAGWAIRYEFVSPDAAVSLDLGAALNVAAWAGAQPVTTPLVVVGGYDGANTLWRATSEQQFVQAALGTTGYPDAFTVGADAAGTGDFAAMDLARLIVANYTGQSDLDILLGYLAWEYGLEATLPPDSPYLGAAPEVSEDEATGRVFNTIDVADFGPLPAPADSELGNALAVQTPAGSSDFVALARTNAAGVNEWYREGDSFQVSTDDFVSLPNVPATVTLYSGAPYSAVDLREWNEVRLAAYVSGAGVTSDAMLLYTSDTTYALWSHLTLNMIDLSSTGFKETAWEPIPSGAKLRTVLIGVGARNGNGTEDPNLRAVVAQFRR